MTIAPGEISPGLSEAALALLRDRALVRARDAIPRRTDPGSAPLSYGQQRIWMHGQLEPGSTAYHSPVALRIDGALDEVALARALDAIVDRHEILRTTFDAGGADGLPVQRIAPSGAMPLTIEEVPGADPEVRWATAERRMVESAGRPFVLAAAPPVRAHLFWAGPARALLLVTFHHIACDGWSVSVFLDELADAYTAAQGGEPPALDPPRVQYADYSAWERAEQGGRQDRDLAYWMDALDGADTVLRLPTDRPHAAEHSACAGRVSAPVSRELTEALRALGRGEGATLFMTIAAALQVLLARYAGQDDFLIGIPVAGRGRAELDRSIGCFINTLALRCDLTGSPTVRELLGRVRRRATESLAHQSLPFDLLVEALQPRRDSAASPLVQVILNFRNLPPAVPALAGLEVTRLPYRGDATMVDLDLEVVETAEGLTCTLVYAAALYDADRAGRMLDHLVRLLGEAVAHPDAPALELTFLSDLERGELLGPRSGQRAGSVESGCVHHLIADRAARTPDALAITGPAGDLSYGALLARAGAIAAALRARGVDRGDRVGLCVRRSPDLIAAMLGIMAAGAAYVPLEAEYPPDRLAMIAADADLACIVTDVHCRGSVPPHAGVVLLDDLPPAAFADWQPGPATPGDPAYVIYTSGSTGRPKGVVVGHGSVVALLQGARSLYGLTPADRMLQFSTPSFDASVIEIFASLEAGGVCVLRDGAMAQSVDGFVDGCARWGVTTCLPPTAFWHEVVGSLAAERRRLPESLRLVAAAGERMLPARAAEWPLVAPHCRLLNVYGPTETTVIVTGFDVTPEGYDLRGSVPIGRPLANARAYVLDRWRQLAPDGVPGELWIGGPQVADGYLCRDELTAQRFVPSPFIAGDRLYRTGDLVRWRPDGELECLGRLDGQVKIRGFRVETGEVEAALLALPEVRGCAVVPRIAPEGDTRLVAFVVPRAMPAEPEALAGRLRRRLGETLPEFMVPAQFVAVESLPRNVNGKLDLARLPVPSAAAVLPPTTPDEAVIAAIWCDILGRTSVGTHDDFFALGGHSLLAMRVLARLGAAFPVRLGLDALFAAPTVAGLARRIVGELAGDDATDATIPRLSSDVAPLTPAQETLWLVSRVADGAPYVVADAWRIKGEVDVTALRRALSAVAARHDALRMMFRAGERGPVQTFRPASAVPLALHDLRGLPPDDAAVAAAARLAECAQTPFDLAAGALLRATLIRVNDDEWLCALATHHIVYDGWSREILMRDVSAAYHDRNWSAGGRPESQVRFVDVAAWQCGRLTGDRVAALRAYWHGVLDGAEPLVLPADHRRPPTPSFRGDRVTIVWPRDLLDRLRALGRQHGATLHMVLVATMQVLLHRNSGQEDIVVGSALADRHAAAVADTIGYLVNTFAIRTSLEGDPSFAAVLQRVRSACLGAYAHADLPFDALAGELRAAAGTGTPALQAMVVLESPIEPLLELGDARVELLTLPGHSAKFELSLLAAERRDGLHITVEYRTELFERSTIERLIRQLATLAERVSVEPERPVGTLALVEAEERAALLRLWTGPSRPYPTHATVHGLILDQCARTPNAVAVSSEDGALTFAELERRSACLAARLVAQGIGRGATVGICLERSSLLVVALLGVLRSGAAYVPLDPDYPADRLDFMIRDAAPAVVLSERSHEPRLGGGVAPVLWLDEPWPAAEALLPAPDDDPSAPAYIIYTSGSTGRPKGAVNSHAGVVNRLCWAQDEFRLTPAEAVLQKTPFSFDVSVWELFWPLMRGARIVLARPGGHRDARYLVDLIERERVTLLHFVPSMLGPFLDELAPGRCATIRDVLCSGEELPAALARRFFAVAGDAVRLHNLYGPTEAAVDVTCWQCRPGDDGDRVPIGRPVANTWVRVLDHRLEPVPPGVPGELFLGGVQVGIGYHGRPELTAERFVDDPMTPGSRVYRTGDIVVCREDGALVYLGRNDGQVKIRGQRVELGEIEAVLRAHPAVREAAVIADRSVTGETRLLAFVVAAAAHAGDGEPLGPMLRESLAAALPGFMVPSSISVLEQFPQLANGKLDRAALPRAAPVSPAARRRVSPRSPLEHQLVGIWEQMLGVDGIGVDDDFFALGGHSLVAMRMAAEVERVTGRTLRLGSLFEGATVERIAPAFPVRLGLDAFFAAPTIAEFARLVADAMAREHGVVLPPVRIAGDTAPLTPAQETLWLLDHTRAGPSPYLVVEAWRCNGPLDVEALRGALNALVVRHEAFRTRFRLGEAGPVQAIAPAEAVPVAEHDLRALTPQRRSMAHDALLAGLAVGSFALDREQLLRVALIHTAPDEATLIVSTHHIVTDGWSRALMFGELRALYRAACVGTPAALAPLPLRLVDIAAWARGRMDGPEFTVSADFWRRCLAGAPPRLALAPSPPAGGGPATESRATELWPGEFLASLRRLAVHHNATLHVVLVAAVQLVLQRLAGEDDVVVATPFAGRDHSATHGVIGYLVNMLFVRTDLGGTPAFAEVIDRVRRACRAAYAHGDFPFEALGGALRAGGGDAAPPTLQVVVAHHPLAPDPLVLDGVIATRIDLPAGPAKFDLWVEAAEQSDGLRVTVRCRQGELGPDMATAMLRHLRVLLERGMAAPEAPAISLPLVSGPERDALLQAGIGAAEPYPRDASLVALVGRQAALRPEAVAVVAPDATLSYRALDRAATTMAYRLSAAGVRPGDRVAVLLDRSAALVTAMLAVLKAGAAYVPIDPGNPAARVTFLLDDADPAALVTTATHAATLASLALPVLDVADAGGVPESSASLPAVGAMDPACVLYTSGSTGAPKGVVVPHRAIVRLITATDYVHLGPDDVVAQVSNVAFDAATFEIWGALANGARVAVLARDLLLDSAALQDALADGGVTVLFLTTALFNQVARQQPGAFRGVRELLFGGEAADPNAVRAVLAGGAPARLLNMYGPTEATTFALWHEVTDVPAGATGVPLGRPIANGTAHVLDAGGEPCPCGVVGELYLGGDGVALGYHRRPELDAQHFLPGRPGAGLPGPLYRTGDLVRRRDDGLIEFVGRQDGQVKIRGFRVELGEVEAALAATGQVTACAVVAERVTGGNVRLAAGVVPAPGAAPSAASLRRALRERLPDFMLPASFVVLDALPLLPSGKLDRQAVLARAAMTLTPAESVPPRSPVEYLLLGIWERVLGRTGIGVRDDFFALGGDSLTAMRMAAEVKRAIGRAPRLAVLFECATVERLAQELLAEAAPSEPHHTLLNPGGTRTPLVFFHGDLLGGGLYCRQLAAALGADQPIHVVAPRVGGAATIEAMAEAELAWLRRTLPVGPYRLGGYCNGGLIAAHLARRLDAETGRVELVVVVDAGARNAILEPLAGVIRAVSTALGRSEAERVAIRARIAPQLARQLWRWRRLRSRPPRERAECVLRGLHRLARRVLRHLANGAPALALHPAAMPAHAWMERAVHGYLPEATDLPIHVLAARSATGPGYDTVRGWRILLPHGTVHLADATHAGIVTSHLPELLRQAIARLDTPRA